MKLYHSLHRGGNAIDGVTEAICEGGAGWLRGKPAPQMHVGGWVANAKAMQDRKPQPPIDAAKAKEFWSYCADGDVVLSNFFEDKTDAYHAKQLVAALRPAQPKCQVYHYGFPSFAPNPDNGTFWNRIKSVVDGLAPGYYDHDGSDPETWSHDDYCRMTYQLAESRRLIGESEKQLGFVISPQTHGGRDVNVKKLVRQVEFLELAGVDVLFVWSQFGMTPHNLEVIKAVAR